ncbi:MAG TPA: OmpA family protein [Candidatus Acidoferrales bacterium]|jgi:peptidoglycan-associated lipoprotein|nr:OmpA family protein [Candidatus Acidoferrales bacterium]
MLKKLIYSGAIAMAAAIVATGCAHKPVGVTPIPPRPEANVGDQTAPTYPQQQLANQSVTSQPLAENGPFDPSKWTQDRDALAANTIHFAFDSAVIRDSETANLQAVAAALNSDKNLNLMIEGNCDERGTEEYNRSLGERRAEAAREALVGMGIDVNRLHTVSYGKDKPAEHGHDEAAWSKNRRDDFVLLHPKTGA